MSKRERNFEDLLNTAEIKDYFFRVERDMFPKLRDSAISLSIFSGHIDAKLALETGAAVLFDKPIILLVLQGARIPENLRKVAAIIVEIDGLQTDEDRQKVTEAIQAVMGGRR